ncbi:MAG TPA: hypothetical protein VGP21_02040, partial [Opitutaceae bacterium]|nr:hypothetical protein [Opitutaceae bacterium]
NEVLSSDAKSTVTKAASCDELFGSFAEAAFVTALRLFTGLDIQEHKDRKEILPAIIPNMDYIPCNSSESLMLNTRVLCVLCG